MALLVVIIALAYGLHRTVSEPHPALNAVERGRQVYIAEGCINCHSQYVRPNSPDVLLWGPTESVAELHAQRPPLIGNRRQGPDLSQVGGRRSPLWLEAHFSDPRQLNPASFMPSYAYLFRSNRGSDLIAYLASLKSASYRTHIEAEQSWQPVSASCEENGPHLFATYCATCHEAKGATRIAWLSRFRQLPSELQTGPWRDLPAKDTSSARSLRLERIIKFGIPGTDMPGHEYFSDRDILSLAHWLNESMARPVQLAVTTKPQGESR